MKLGVPADRICDQKLSKADSQICDIRLGKSGLTSALEYSAYI